MIKPGDIFVCKETTFSAPFRKGNITIVLGIKSDAYDAPFYCFLHKNGISYVSLVGTWMLKHISLEATQCRGKRD